MDDDFFYGMFIGMWIGACVFLVFFSFFGFINPNINADNTNFCSQNDMKVYDSNTCYYTEGSHVVYCDIDVIDGERYLDCEGAD